MKKEEIIKIAEALGFKLSSDSFDDYGEWMSFRLDSDLHEEGFTWMWRKSKSIDENLYDAGVILFRAGQKAFKTKLSRYIDL